MYLLASIPHVTTLIAPLAANFSMRIDIWIPLAFAMACLVLCFFVLWAMPESLRRHPIFIAPDGPVDSTSPLLNGDQHASTQTEPQRSIDEEGQAMKEHAGEPWLKTLTDIVALVQTPGLLLCLALIALRPIAIVSRIFVYQHASESFGWPMSSTTWLRFSQATSSSSITLVFLPLLSNYLDRRGRHARELDLNVIRISLLISSISFAIIWRSSASWMLLAGLFVDGLGEGFEPSLKGLATSLIESSYNARLLTLVAALEVVAKLIGGPVMARLFSIGRGEDHGSEGICFLASAVLLLVLAGAAFIARIQT